MGDGGTDSPGSGCCGGGAGNEFGGWCGILVIVGGGWDTPNMGPGGGGCIRVVVVDAAGGAGGTRCGDVVFVVVVAPLE